MSNVEEKRWQHTGQSQEMTRCRGRRFEMGIKETTTARFDCSCEAIVRRRREDQNTGKLDGILVYDPPLQPGVGHRKCR